MSGNSGEGGLAMVMEAVKASYSDLALSIPLVLAGILITGTLYYVILVRPQLEKPKLTAWLAYLFPREHYTGRSARIDIWIWLLNGLIFIPLFEISVALFGLAMGVSVYDILLGLGGERLQIADSLLILAAVQFLGFWFGQGFGQYVGHLAMHKIPLFWALHRAHHSAESSNLFTFLRSHPVEHFINGATRVAGAAFGIGLALYVTGGQLLPNAIQAIFWFNILYVLIGFRSVDHLHIPVRYGPPLDVLLGSPIMHQLHHSAELQHRDKNMGGAGYLFDWMFGTLYIPKSGETWRWGLNDEELAERNPHNTVRAFFIEPITTMGLEWRRLFSPRRKDIDMPVRSSVKGPSVSDEPA
jgi:sterol desaturase/sphingolipid hydroxylase (fatty acid hydroxylase superfamily)